MNHRNVKDDISLLPSFLFVLLFLLSLQLIIPGVTSSFIPSVSYHHHPYCGRTSFFPPPNRWKRNMNLYSDMKNTTSEEENVEDPLTNETTIPSQRMTLQELSFREEKASRELLGRLLLPSRIVQAWTGMVQIFVVIGILLNAFGYGYIRTEHGIGIDTLEHRQFQIELYRRP
jgi:hypothetical protein